MARPLRIEFPGAIYHVTSRGDRQEAIYHDNIDHQRWLLKLEKVCLRFNWVVYAYCQMRNHYHLLVETVDGNLSRGMRQLNGQYTQYFNKRHKLVGHLYQGRYKAILVQKESYLLELIRYVMLNPVRADIVTIASDWEWSSCRSTIDTDVSPDWLDVNWVLSQFSNQHKKAIALLKEFLSNGIGIESPLDDCRYQLFLGDDQFIEQHCNERQITSLSELSKNHKKPLVQTLESYMRQSTNRDIGMALAYLSGAYTMAEIADHVGVHYMTVSRAVRKYEKEKSS
ncbi:MAG: transposase [Gammaproteobacteria bacterium]